MAVGFGSNSIWNSQARGIRSAGPCDGGSADAGAAADPAGHEQDGLGTEGLRRPQRVRALVEACGATSAGSVLLNSAQP